jgi:hypothetical protein
VASGHLHQYRSLRWRDLDLVWAPSTAFVTRNERTGAQAEVGWIRWTLEGDEHHWSFETAPDLVHLDLDAVKGGRSEYLYQLPASPPDLGNEPGA